MTIAKVEARPTNAGKPIILTVRDRDLLHDIHRFGLLSTDQIAALHFQSLHRARKRMRKLWLHGFVKRIVRPVVLGDGSEQYLYKATSLAHLLIGTNRDIKRQVRVNSHALAINDFRICLELALQHRADIQLGRWHEDGTLSVPVGRGAISIVPDSYFSLTMDKKRLHYFVEVDRGTADLKRITEKLRRYLDLWKHRECVPLHDFHAYRVLYVTQSPRRAKNILNLIASLPNTYRRDLINVIDSSQVSLPSPERLFGPIWQAVNRSGYTQPKSPLPAAHPLTLPTLQGNSPEQLPRTEAR